MRRLRHRVKQKLLRNGSLTDLGAKVPHYSPIRVLMLMMAAIFAVELIIMVTVFTDGESTAHHLKDSLVDSLLLTLVLYPISYLFVYRPLALNIAKRKAAEEALRKAHDDLEVRVEERTTELARVNDELRNEVAEREQREQELAYLAAHDPLTGLPNRRSLEEAMVRAVAQARRGTPGALLFLDVDNFKLVNDNLGHATGDEVLVHLAAFLRKQLRAEDLLARFGGDEFAVLQEGVTPEEARKVAERMCRKVEEFKTDPDGPGFNLSLSIGLVPIEGETSPGILLSQADAATYEAKKLGRNRVVVNQAGTDGLAWLSAANGLVTRLKDGFEKERFVLYYQPVVRLSTGQTECYEALIRLRGEMGEIIPASDFVPMAEHFGFMHQLTRWVVQSAIQTLREYPETCLSVNLSGFDLTDESLPAFIEAHLGEHNVESGRLTFEITESALIMDLMVAERCIQRLRALGCRFALDDFGTGYLSFAHMHKLTVDMLKIDGSFIRGLETDPSRRAFVRAMQSLASAQGRETVAECIENEVTALMLKDMGITFGQGYHFGKPGPDLPRDVPDVKSVIAMEEKHLPEGSDPTMAVADSTGTKLCKSQLSRL